MKQMRPIRAVALAAFILLFVRAGTVRAGELNCTAGCNQTFAGAFFTTTDSQSTGTGVIQSFVRLSTNDPLDENGFNTSFRPLSFDENTSPSFTRDLLLTAVPIVTIGGVQYREFLLDINQQSANPLLTLNELQIFLTSAHGTSYNTVTDTLTITGGGTAAPIYNLGANDVLLNYNLNSGSGSGDLFVYIPDSLFTGGGTFVTLWSSFGSASAPNNDGFEEWAVRTPIDVGTGTPPVPEPGTLTLLGCGLVGMAGILRRRCSK